MSRANEEAPCRSISRTLSYPAPGPGRAAWPNHAAHDLLPPQPRPCGVPVRPSRPAPASMKWRELRENGHWPTLATSFLYFDVSFMVWTLLGALGALITPALGLSAQQKFLMVSPPVL